MLAGGVMALTGWPLLAASVLALALAAGGCVVLWRRPRRWPLPLRAGALLLCEVLLLWSAAVTLNRGLDLYPTWSSLGAAPPALDAARRLVDCAIQ
jgi:hypothetical protein